MDGDGTTGEAPKPARRNRSLIGTSPNRDEYVRLIEQGWTSVSLERYAAYRYGEDIKAATFRQYKSRKKIEVKPSVLLGDKTPKPETRIDVANVRQELVDLQMRRIAIDAAHESSMNKLLGSTGREIDLLSKLLDQVKADQQDYGVLPTVAQRLQVDMLGTPAPGSAPKHRTLGEVLGTDDPVAAAAVARALHNVIPINRDEREVG